MDKLNPQAEDRWQNPQWWIIGSVVFMALATFSGLMLGGLVLILLRSEPAPESVQVVPPTALPPVVVSPTATAPPIRTVPKVIDRVETLTVAPRVAPTVTIDTVIANRLPAEPTKTDEPTKVPPVVPLPMPMVRADSPPPAPTERVVTVKRISFKTPDQLSRQLLKTPELDLESARGTTQQVIAFAAQHRFKIPHVASPILTQRRDLAGLPMAMGYDCQIGKDSATNLQALSRKLRTQLTASAMMRAGLKPDAINVRLPAGIDTRPDHVFLRNSLTADGERDGWTKVEAVPTLVQMLQAEDRPLRMLMVEMLSKVPNHTATAALAQRAVFDLSEEVREAAIKELAKRQPSEYRQILLNGLRYPWAPAAEHAAEAIAALKLTDTLPELINLLDLPDPSAPVSKKVQSQATVRELVRVNHLRNCLLCHAPSFDRNDLVRGRIPLPGQELPPSFTPQYYETDSPGQFVRADITYLKQDFAVPQPVANPGAWPAHQRYDYLVRTRWATSADLLKTYTPEYPQREAVLFALRELTGKDLGRSSESWRSGIDR